ncbi:MAG TPA: Clp protease N-terminal domain-containing protein [Solirubrobacteraceae bacterium]|jgi:hypothetical protein|nr:Clp protease N-terminal domain-containing protein [Solirubrobacteraceae bacterium]
MTPSPTLQELIDTVRSDAASADPLVQLTQASGTASDLQELADALLDHYVEQCRGERRSWAEISAALGVTKQAAHKRYAFNPPTFNRFTDRARAVVRDAETQARERGERSVGPEHLLLALFDAADGAAAKVLAEVRVTQSACEERLGVGPRGQEPAGERVPLGAVAKQALRGALDEALGFEHNYIGTEHMLLSLVQAAEEPVGRALADLGTSYEDIRERIVRRFG